MKYIGLCLFTIAVFLGVMEYKRVIFARVSECREFLSFIRHIRLKSGCFLSTPRECAMDFKSEELSQVGFFDKLLECSDVYEAYIAVSEKLHLLSEEREVLERVFKNIGEGYLDDTIKLLDYGEGELTKILSVIETDAPKRVKLASALSVTGGIGFLILLL